MPTFALRKDSDVVYFTPVEDSVIVTDAVDGPAGYEVLEESKVSLVDARNDWRVLIDSGWTRSA